jgi:serine/threonine protein kinase
MGEYFMKVVDTYRVYTGYVQNYYRAITTINQCKQSNPAFTAFLKNKEIEAKTAPKDLSILLLCPITRINQFTKQLQMLIDATSATDPTFHGLGVALAKIKHFSANLRERAKIVEAQHKVQIIQDAVHGKFETLSQPHRLYVMEGHLVMLTPPPPSPRISRRLRASTLDLATSATSTSLPVAKSFYCFMFNDVLLFTREKKEYYVFESMHELKDLEVQAKTEDNLLQITFTGTSEKVCLMDATRKKKRDEWVEFLSKYIKEAVEKDLLKRPAPKDLSTSGGTINFETAEIIMGKHIGSGGSGCRVEKCTVDGKPCAVKILPLNEQQQSVVKEGFVNEIKIVEQLHHPNIIEYLGHIRKTTPSELWLYMDYYPLSLKDYLENRIGKHLCLADIVWIGLSVAKGIEFLHTQKPPIMHRDLKSANILLSLDEGDKVKIAKITDFDTAKIMYSDVLLHTAIGTPCYMAPEVMDISMMPVGTTYSLKADVYSFGMILVELITLKPPYDEVEHTLHLTQKILSGEPPTISHPSLAELDDVVQLIKKCIAFQPEKRPDAATVVKSLKKMMRDIPFSQLSHYQDE